MPRYICFLRGMNLGRRRLKMSRLKSLIEELGFEEVTTFIASGNVIFSSDIRDVAELERRISNYLEKSLGYVVDSFVRTAAEVIAIGKTKMFQEEGQEGVTVYVG